jgi:hypothetical protein
MRPLAFVLALLIIAGGATGCAAPAATPLPTATLPPATATVDPESLKVTLYYEGNSAQFELISPAGTRVLLDVVEPAFLSSPATAQDALITTTNQDDHFRLDFLQSFPGQQLNRQEGEIKLAEVSIKTIASAQFPTDEFLPKDGTNYIARVDMGGLRIVHFGDIGQTELTPEQLSTLGKVDIAIIQLNNPLSDMSVTNKKAFNLTDQVKPKLVIPTHTNLDAAKYAVEKWKGYAHQGKVTFGPASLPAETSILFLGPLAPSYQAIYKLPDW